MIDGKYCKVINRITGEIIASGKIINHKDVPVKCISFDNKYFFNLKKKLFYKIIFCDYCDEIKFDNIKYKNKIILWRKAPVKKNAFVYREYDINELDDEIKDLVHIINKLNLRTVGSCSGHNEKPAWVDISFINFKQLKKFLEILSSDKFYGKFTLSSDILVNSVDDEIILRLKTNSIGKKAYADIDYLTKYLNEMYKIIEHIPEFYKN